MRFVFFKTAIWRFGESTYSFDCIGIIAKRTRCFANNNVANNMQID